MVLVFCRSEGNKLTFCEVWKALIFTAITIKYENQVTEDTRYRTGLCVSLVLGEQ
jgi:hypothetical protein